MIEFPLILTTANARFAHTSLSLLTLYANLGPLQTQAHIIETIITDAAVDIAEKILQCKPKVIGISVYIWNVELLTEVVHILKSIHPEIILVIGGPEVSHSLEGLKILDAVDYVIQGEGEVVFAELCGKLLSGVRPEGKVFAGGMPDLSRLALPYSFYTDLRRTIYVEASRGCPYQCSFCLSALDTQVRYFPLDQLLSELGAMIDRGGRHFKFIDRTFNLKIDVSRKILSFFLERYQEGMLFHFEMVPDRFPDELRELVMQFPAGSLQFEVGVQTLNEATGKVIQRRQNLQKLEENFRFLADHTGIHVHADLIIGLPGESLDSFGAGLNRLFALGPQEIQVGILKRLRGAPIQAVTGAFAQVYSLNPPYEVLQTGAMDFLTMQRAKRFAFVWDRLVNRGNLNHTFKLLLAEEGPFYPVLGFADFLHAQAGQVHAISLDRLAEGLRDFLVQVKRHSLEVVCAALAADYAATKRNLPGWLKAEPTRAPARDGSKFKSRQEQHLRNREA